MNLRRLRAVVAVDVHGSITLEGVESLERRIDGDLLVVDTQTVAVGIGVGEQARLQDGVGGRLNTWNQVRRRESNLLNLGEVVLDVSVQGELAEWSQRHVLLGPDLGQIEDVPAELLSLLRGQDLDVDSPARVLALLNGLEKILGVPVRVLGSHLAGLLVGEGLVALVGLEVDLGVDEGTIRLGPLVSVTRVAIHVPVGVGSATV